MYQFVQKNQSTNITGTAACLAFKLFFINVTLREVNKKNQQIFICIIVSFLWPQVLLVGAVTILGGRKTDVDTCVHVILTLTAE